MSLEHCARILKKNELRECDKQEYRKKEWTHDNMYYDVLECLKKKDKTCLNY